MAVPVKKAVKKTVKAKKEKKVESTAPKKIELKDFKPDHQNFILEYIKTRNATKSYMKAYPKSKYDAASVSSFQLLRNPKIKEYIQCYYDELWNNRKVEIGRTFDNLLKIANADISDVVEFDGDRMNVKPFDKSDTFLISEIKETVSEHQHGVNVNRSVKLKDSGKALSELLKVLGMVTEKVEHTGEIVIVPARKPEKEKGEDDE